MEKVILEEIESMKYLLGYKRGVVISEQDMDNDIDPKLVASAEQPAATTVTPAAGTEQPVTPAPTTGPIKMGVYNPRVKYLQELLNYKFQSGLIPDGKYGPKTGAAILKNIAAINQTQLKPVEPINKSAEVVQLPGATITPNTNIPVK